MSINGPMKLFVEKIMFYIVHHSWSLVPETMTTPKH